MILYIGNLPRWAREAELTKWFNQRGFPAIVTGITQAPENGSSQVIGFVDMLGPRTAERATRELNGKIFGGSPILISEIPPAGRIRELFNALAWSHELFELEQNSTAEESASPAAHTDSDADDAGPRP